MKTVRGLKGVGVARDKQAVVEGGVFISGWEVSAEAEGGKSTPSDGE